MLTWSFWTVVYIITQLYLKTICSFLTFYSSNNPEKVSQVSNFDNKSALHKMYFNVNQINAGLMTISD